MKHLKGFVISAVACCLFCGCGELFSEPPARSSAAENSLTVYEAGVSKNNIRPPVLLQSDNSETASIETKTQPFSGQDKNAQYENGALIGLDMSWEFADFSVINSGFATLFKAEMNRKNITVGVNAGHGTSNVGSKKTYCHPDKTPKVTDGTTAEGAIKAIAVSSGMDFKSGTSEAKINLKVATLLKELLLKAGYDVLMIRTDSDIQLDNVARTVICNNVADCHIAIHFDGDGLDYDKGIFYMAVPDGIKNMYPVSTIWQEDDRLGESLVEGLRTKGQRIMGSGSVEMDLTQTSYSKIPSVDIELGNQCTDHNDSYLSELANGLKAGVDLFFR